MRDSVSYAIARPFIRMSHEWISQKMLRLGSRNFRHTVAHPSSVINDGGVGKIGGFRPLSRYISETVQDMTKVVIDHYRNVYTCFRLVPKSITLDDLELITAVFASLYFPRWRFSASLYA